MSHRVVFIVQCGFMPDDLDLRELFREMESKKSFFYKLLPKHDLIMIVDDLKSFKRFSSKNLIVFKRLDTNQHSMACLFRPFDICQSLASSKL